VNPRAGCPGPGPRTGHRRLRRRWPVAAPAEGDDFRPLAGDPGQVQTRDTGPGEYGFDAPARSVTVSHDRW